jgi:3-hydroxy-3-methylglutaryl CoA synthase
MRVAIPVFEKLVVGSRHRHFVIKPQFRGRPQSQRLGIAEDRTAVVIDRYGNTSSASIPLALYDSIENGRVHDGDHLLLTGFGGGMTWASAVFRWSA